MEKTPAQTLPIVSITPQALGVVRSAMDQEGSSQEMALWLEVRGASNGAYTYDLYIQPLADARSDDEVMHHEEIAVIVPSNSVEQLRGARLEWSDDGEGGLVLVNPNTPVAVGGARVPADVLAMGIDGPLAKRIAAVLDEQVNPSIASHGGSAHLVAIDEQKGVVYLSLAGGCQGCAMSRLTLSQGIEVAIRDEVPEVTEVIDVTDHEVGASPYYS